MSKRISSRRLVFVEAERVPTELPLLSGKRPELLSPIEIDGVMDISGHPIAASVIASFTTGPSVDLVRPDIVTSSPLAPGSGHNTHLLQRDVLPGQGANHRLAPDGIPQGLGCLVVHQFVGAVEKTAGSQLVIYPIELRFVQNLY